MNTIKLIIILSLIPLKSLAQEEDTYSFSESFFTLSEYIIISSSNFSDDIEFMDSLYQKAIKISGDTGESLFLISMISLPYKSVPVKIPLLSLKYRIPLPALPEKLFLERSQLMPGLLFFDTPAFEDKDKISHFFGNAYLSYSMPYFNISKFMGILIELFENSFISSGEFDLRDLMVNELGSIYGSLLKKNPDIVPSDLIKTYSIYYFRLFN